MEDVQQRPEENNHKIEIKGFLLRQGPPNIPDTLFQDIIEIWDTFRSFAEIVNEILTNKDQNNASECIIRQVGVNVGQMQHFSKFFKNYFLHLSLNDFYDCFKQIDSNQFYVDILLFLASFYLKQIIEDVEQENQYSRFYHKASIWQLLNFLWMRDQEAYYEVITEKASQIDVDIRNYGILQPVEEKTIPRDPFEVRMNLVKELSEGLMELKKTSTLLQYRTESILFSNRLRQTFCKDIRDTRSKLVVTKEALNKKESLSVTLKSQLEQGHELTRQEQSKINRQIDQIQKEIYKLRSQSNKESKQLDEFQESYDSLDKTIKYSTLPQLNHNSSLFLGGDQDSTLYYFFLHDPVRIYYQKGIDSKRWGYINKHEQIEKLIKNQNQKMNKEQNLRVNLQLLLSSKLMQNDSQVQKLNPIVIEYVEINSWKKIVDQLMRAELNLSTYLATHQGRWIGPEERRLFRQNIQNLNPNESGLREVSKQIDLFIQKTVIQERLEVKNDGNLHEEQHNGLLDMEDVDQEEYNIPTKKRRVVEDESDSLTTQGVQLDMLEHMDTNKIVIKKLPLKLFGNLYDSIRTCCLDILKNSESTQGDILLVVFIIERIIQDYVARKMEKEQEQNKTKQLSVVELVKTESIIQEFQTTKTLRLRPKQKPQYAESENSWEDQCKICGQAGKVICCDTCPSVFHSKCLGLKQVPMGKWSCFQCLSRMEAQIKTRATLRKFQA